MRDVSSESWFLPAFLKQMKFLITKNSFLILETMTRWYEQLNLLRGKNGKKRQEIEEHKNNQTFRRGNQNCAGESENCALRKQIIDVKLDGKKDWDKAVGGSAWGTTVSSLQTYRWKMLVIRHHSQVTRGLVENTWHSDTIHLLANEWTWWGPLGYWLWLLPPEYICHIKSSFAF